MTTRGGRIKGNSTLSVQVRGVSEIQRALRPLLEPEITKILDASNKRAANTLAKAVRAEARPVSRHMAKAVRVKRARTGKPGWVVGSKRKIAFFWPFVIGGTRDHGPRKADALVFVPGWNPYLGTSSHGVGNKVVRVKRVHGVKANDLVERAARKAEPGAFRDAERQFIQETGL